ncbi:MAG: L-methionine (R)-S-oxide reductase [Pseudoalteromonas rhizosphaerae]|jgi:L-methionine (R)-S-oxide reductase|uniref:GAF domain-containing protein n=1 Tax=Pseudoalteromonas neustonica TaxID=1840331 RepID=A0ABY3FHY0_9GAMM|nr:MULTISPECIES: GAF domain-containing protein [Pseudoalteromonas]MBB1292045.1 GAF domain-containing protein [Pseudoalteromonas sp. SR41-4]MBB1300389.1 GAF domain-containing protein [Pseudoalteromonas sp. SR44-8]MBB1308329.1 GAF domain-containing protein [Pseudoalteromonas sp. SR41-8]MBB1397413.1 GAF domain-containing protein [Pseudoalteromonas sp. SG44-8]MBB1408986.1 GAF domain-containing protein [Pseudoalteromonas sp. SG44-17]|tara:strand:+ start:21188 stop:21649 length:462 start_codon:yes stop_codon:yes gene_type:complete
MQKQEFYQSLVKQTESLITGEPNIIANMANISALLFTSLDDVNWAGFYLMDSPTELVLGPFQGNPACIRIPVGKGVCGTAAATAQTQLVEDVHAFAGHIACDAASNSEIVIPIHKNGEVFAVLDIDSPSIARFDVDDKQGLEALVACFEATIA